MLEGQTILIVEDNSLLALDLAATVEAMGGRVAGPVATVEAALLLVENDEISGAVLDCELRDGDAGPILAALAGRAVPIIICSGTGPLAGWTVPMSGIPVLMKPQRSTTVLEALAWQIRRAPMA